MDKKKELETVMHLNDQSIKNNDSPFDTTEESYCGIKTQWIGIDFDQLWIEKLKGKVNNYNGKKLKLCIKCSDIAVERIMTII